MELENDKIASPDKDLKPLLSVKIDNKLKTMNLILKVKVSLHLQKLIYWA